MAEISVDLTQLTRKVDQLSIQANAIGVSVNEVGQKVDGISSELLELRQQFEKMVIQEQRNAALQKATTELVRVRQEIDSNFGNYKVVRETMLGVLQATDAKLVKQTTISRVSEELMLSTPKYWLAPCLVAVAAWISNDRDLAERAIAEAVKRDEEKTAICMALICRRNKRTSTCFEWLKVYFEKQDPQTFNEGDFAYIDSYVNGVFGVDEKHICDGYIEKWMNQIRTSDAAYDEKQTERWKEFCTQYTANCDSIYPDLKEISPDYWKVNSYISRINAVTPICEKFEKITEANVDQDVLKGQIDKKLLELISKYDEDEMELREEEIKIQAVKDTNGDLEEAKKIFYAKTSENREKVRSLIEQMYEVVNRDSGVTTSQKKTAINFVKSDINRGIDRYIKENKEQFPDSVSISIDDYNDNVTGSNDKSRVVSGYQNHMVNCMQNRVAKAREDKKPTLQLVGGIALGVIGIILLFSIMPLGIAALAGAGVLIFMSFKSRKKIEANVAEISEYYRKRTEDGAKKINGAIDQWEQAKKCAEEFDDSNIKAV